MRVICDTAIIFAFPDEVSVSVCDLWRRNYFSVYRGSFCVNDLRRRSFIGVCRGGVSLSV